MSLILALVFLAVSLVAAAIRPRLLPEWLAAAAGAGVLLALGAIDWSQARDTISDLGPTVGLLAALLLLAEGCRREGLFDALGALMARRARGRPRSLLALVFVVASSVTAVLSLDATVVLLTPVVLVTAARMRTSPKPHIYACSHLANSSSLLLPVSNLTNLVAFAASGLSFSRFAGLMALPTLAVVAVEWLVLSRFFATELDRPRADVRSTGGGPPLPRAALVVLALTLAGFALSSLAGVAPVWVAVAGAAAITLPALVRRATSPVDLVRAAEPGLVVFVLGLGVIVAAASDHGLGSAVEAVLPSGDSLGALLLVAAVSAVAANLLNNLPATLILVPVAAMSGPAPVLAVLIGVNVGPNLTYAGSLATLLWRRVLRHEDEEVELGEFLRLGALTVPAGIVAATVVLWFSHQVLG